LDNIQQTDYRSSAMIEDVDSLQKVKMLFFAKPHVGLVKHIEGVDLEKVKEVLSNVLDIIQINWHKFVEGTGGRIDLVGFIDYKGANLRLWITVIERSDVGCVIETRVYHVLEESAKADEFLSHLSKTIDEKLNML